MKFNKKAFEKIDSDENLDLGFEDIVELSKRCKFSNCSHTNEPECAVKKAIVEGTLTEERVNTYFREINEAIYISHQKNKTKAVDYMKQRKLFRKP